MKRTIKRISRLAAILGTAAALLVGSLPQAAAKGYEYPLSELADNGLPVVYVTVGAGDDSDYALTDVNNSPDHSFKATGTVRIDVPDGYKGDYSDVVLEDTEELPLEYIRGRGNFTWQLDKKPYKLKLEKKAELLGMGKNKHWALLANRCDYSFIRNRIVGYISERLGFEYTPKMLPVDLVINGKYAGSYYLSETVRIGGNRLDIDELTPEDEEEPEITGSYLMSMYPFFFRNEYDERNVYTTGEGVDVWFESPEFFNPQGDAEGTAKQLEYIKSYIDTLEGAIMSDNFKTEDGTPYTELMDIKTAADFWLVQEFVANDDAMISASNYFYKKRGDKLYWGPLWDFDFSMGLSLTEPEGFYHAGMKWLDRLRAYEPEYQKVLRERPDVLDGILDDVLKEGGILDKYAAEVRNSALDDEKYWGSSDMLYRDREAFDKEVEDIRDWLTKRRAWVNEHIDTDLYNVYSTLYFKVDDEIVYVRRVATGSSLRIIPEAP